MSAVKRYTDYSSRLHMLFPDCRIQKISVNAGFTCPNRDGTKGLGGCTYCNNKSFAPEYCFSNKPVRQQVVDGMAFFLHKYPQQKYLVYFQSYTNTYGNIDKLISLYEEALAVPNVLGIIVGTRPDCMSQALLDYFATLSKKKFVLIEYGVESVYDTTLQHINRGHTFAEAHQAIKQTAACGLFVGAHIILGLPNETRPMLLKAAEILSMLPIHSLKMHQLQLIKGTVMAEQYSKNSDAFHFFYLPDYIELVVDFLERLNPSIAIDRFVSQSPTDMVIMPRWGLKNFEFAAKVESRLEERDTFQGKLFQVPL